MSQSTLDEWIWMSFLCTLQGKVYHSKQIVGILYKDKSFILLTAVLKMVVTPSKSSLFQIDYYNRGYAYVVTLNFVQYNWI